MLAAHEWRLLLNTGVCLSAQVLDPVSAPRWRLDCNLCSFLIYLPPSLHSVAVAASKCPVSLLCCCHMDIYHSKARG